MDKSLLPPALAPAPPLTEDEVTEQWRAIFDVEDSGWEWGRRLRRWTETKMQGKRSEGRVTLHGVWSDERSAVRVSLGERDTSLTNAMCHAKGSRESIVESVCPSKRGRSFSAGKHHRSAPDVISFKLNRTVLDSETA
ncbi:hypothetical protein LR48_Vigan08g029600 [Vigna angularis]|uniref:Uncharacterized protein n=1 Tax=Phaseolus angularis TaxID=3914 RepID=A0A0L9V459_PHAAN|nr:hypothetical protein LR48_Vigan08g029600 [Vigna angularis]